MADCLFCGKPTPDHNNYCDGDCIVTDAKRAGGIVHTPNNLPIRCIRHNNMMLECENGDHKDYKFPVTVEYIGTDNDDLLKMSSALGNVVHNNDAGSCFCEDCLSLAQSERGDQTHAFIYTDGCIALTLYECDYILFKLVDGSILYGFYDPKNWKLTDESLEKIRNFHDKALK
jgi:hypothetical protein